MFRKWELWLMILFLLGAAAYAAVTSLRKSRAASVCREHGYPEARVNWEGLGTAYCVKRVDQTDVVVPAEGLP